MIVDKMIVDDDDDDNEDGDMIRLKKKVRIRKIQPHN